MSKSTQHIISKLVDRSQKKYGAQLTDEEKNNIINRTFIHGKNKSNTIKDLAGHLYDNYKYIDGVDAKWSSLITNNPLLFECIDYMRTRQFVDNTTTKDEIEAYQRGELRELYSTFESMLMCNLQYYDRIMCFCTIAFCHYYRIDDEDISDEHIKEVPIYLTLTPTQIWCCALCGVESTEWEINYAWNMSKTRKMNTPSDGISYVEANYNILNKIPLFNKFIAIRSSLINTMGFRSTMLADKTSNPKLAQICKKFTKTSTAISEAQINTVYDYWVECESVTKNLWDALNDSMYEMFCGDTTMYAIYVYNTEFYIHSAKFSMKVTKDSNGKITKDYLANSWECFAAEEYLVTSIKAQIEWAKYKTPIEYGYDKRILNTILLTQLRENYKKIICVKRMPKYGVTSKISFSGIFKHVYINEDLMFDNRVIRSSRVCLSKENAAKYIIDRGYVLFGFDTDVYPIETFTRRSLLDHFSKYCVPVYKHMKEVIAFYQEERKSINEYLTTGFVDINKIANCDIKYADIKSLPNQRVLFSAMWDKQVKRNDAHLTARKNYWKVIED